MIVDPTTLLSTADPTDAVTTIECPISLRRRGVEIRMVLADGTAPARASDAALIDVVNRSQRYLARLVDGTGMSLMEIAAAEQVEPSEISRLLPLAFLSPKLVDQILAGTQPVNLTTQRLLG